MDKMAFVEIEFEDGVVNTEVVDIGVNTVGSREVELGENVVVSGVVLVVKSGVVFVVETGIVCVVEILVVSVVKS